MPDTRDELLRIDAALVARGLVKSRAQAQAALRQGFVKADGEVVVKPAFPVGEQTLLELDGEALRYVGRGGYKLEKALSSFSIDLTGALCLDVGASTGGFTDCMLRCGARRVIAVEGGRDQLDRSLRADGRVDSYEQTDIRRLPEEIASLSYDFIAVDLSFISLEAVFPFLFPLVGEQTRMVCLVKPQFEAGRAAVGKRGVVKDKKVHEAVLSRLIEAVKEQGFTASDLTFSPVTGGEGNVEYLLLIRKSDKLKSLSKQDAKTITEAAFRSFGKR